jgi:hypothetical protein
MRVVLQLAAIYLLMGAAQLGMSAETWNSDYYAAYEAAKSGHKCLLIWFHPDRLSAADEEFARCFDDEQLARGLESFVLVKLPQSSKVEIAGKPQQLLGHAAFAELLKLPGLAIVDLRDKQSEHYGDVVSLYPFRSGKPLDQARLQVLLELPAGTLTQRTLIFAVRTHPDGPRSTQGVFDPLLASETQKHSVHQASITLQGHHNWERRFQLISAKLPDRLLAQEVCAESWPGQHLVEAAEECVHSWRQSSGHWSAVSSAHPRYGYDMKRGKNGVWYATGIFGKR